MNQCLRCNKLCSGTSLFCEECRTLLGRQVDGDQHVDITEFSTSPQVAVAEKSEERVLRMNDDLPERTTIPHPAVISLPETPQPPLSSMGTYATTVEQVLQKLSDAARRIANADRGPGQRARPRIFRLTPLRDISAEIQRHSTPMPKISTPLSPNNDLARKLPDLWPWFQDSDADEDEKDIWANRSDPLMSRSFEFTRAEGENRRRAAISGLSTSFMARQQKKTARLRTAFFCLVILVVLASTIDTILLSNAFMHSKSNSLVTNGFPVLTLSSLVADYGQSITLHLRHFSSQARVALTRDIEEQITLENSSSVVQVGRDGSADPVMLIENNWTPGFHTIQAEDTVTRYTANTTIRIEAGPTRPAHLLIRTTTLDLGAGIQGSNTIEPLVLENSGSGAITWSANSNQPWLMISPNQGVFSANQTIEVGGERNNLSPGNYQGRITFSSNVGESQYVDVTMVVRPLPANAGAVLSVTPPLLSFIATDGGADPNAQFLIVNNPGSQPLYWSLGNNSPTVVPGGGLATIDQNAAWLSIDQTTGVVVPGVTTFIRVSVHSQNLLPGAYINTLVFSSSIGHTALNSPQNVSVSLTVQRPCSLTLSTGSLSFTSVANNGNPSNQTLSLAATSSCPGTIGWQAISSAPWLTITPASGQLRGTASAATTVSVNTSGLAAGTYSANITVTAAQSTQSVMVQLTIQTPPPPSAPILGASPLNLNFSTTQGQPNPPGQTVTITNTGGSPLMWRTSLNLLTNLWLGASPSGGTIQPGQTALLTVNVSASSLSPGTYVGQVVLTGTDPNNVVAGGSPQSIMINFTVLPPCTLQQPSSSSLAFSGMQNGADPTPQSVTVMAAGNCNWPLNWSATINGSAPWLKVSPLAGSFTASGQSTTLSVAPTLAGLAPGTYTAQVSIGATDSASLQAQGSPQTLSVTLTVLQPCQLQGVPSNMSFSVSQGTASPTSQNLALSESGSCARPVSWTATSNSPWLIVDTASGTDNGSGSTIAVSLNTTTLTTPGSYTATITITATGSGNAVVQNSPQIITVTVTVS
ncbi:MAG TPA: hypothetical protein VKY19_15340 [Ktedonosporobacter sp.]|nr:hypothetical protein [Ktedonosporobacter sp.]